MTRKRIARVHFIPPRYQIAAVSIPASVAVVARSGAVGLRPISDYMLAVEVESESPYWIRTGISKVFGASPAIVFTPPGPVASVRREVKQRKINRGWQKFQGMLNDDDDKIRGYDDGEWERQRRAMH